MVLKPATKESPEDSSMKNGIFREYNTKAPDSDRGVHSLFNLKHRTAIVSGAGAGIGYAVAEGLAEAGSNVAIWYYSIAKSNKHKSRCANDIRYHGNKKAIEKAADIEKKYGVKCRSGSTVVYYECKY